MQQFSVIPSLHFGFWVVEDCCMLSLILAEKGKYDLSTPSGDGRKPIHAACQCGHTHVVKVYNII